MLSSVARRLVEEARRLLKHHSSARANPGPAATFPTLWELTEVLMRVLPLEASSTGWSAGMDRARVRIANTPLFLRSPHRALDVPCLYKGAALSAQATSICETDSMMTEVHAHALVNLKTESVVVSHQREVCQENGEATNVITLRAGVG